MFRKKLLDILYKTSPKIWKNYFEKNKITDDLGEVFNYIDELDSKEVSVYAKGMMKSSDASQKAFKRAGNAIYGYLGTPSTRFYSPAIAGAITTQGVQLVTETQDLLEDLGIPIIYGDTDSCFLSIEKFIPKEIKNDKDKIVEWIRNSFIPNEVYPYIQKKMDEIARHNGVIGREHFYEFKQEIVAKRGLFLKGKDAKGKGAKKRYILWLIDEEGVPKDELFIRGVELRRSEMPPFIKDFLYKWVEQLIKEEKTVKELILDLIDFKYKLKKEIENKNFISFSKRVSLTKNLDEYKTFTYVTKGAKFWNEVFAKEFTLDEIEIDSKMLTFMVKLKNEYADGKYGYIIKKYREIFKQGDETALSIPQDLKKMPSEIWDIFELDERAILEKMFYNIVDNYLITVDANVEEVIYEIDDIDDIL